MRRPLTQRILEAGASVLVVVVALFPLLWGFVTSIKPTDRILAYPPELIPARPVLDHYMTVFKSGFGIFLANTVIVTACTVVLCLAIGFLAGYSLARFRFAGRTLILFVIVSVMSIPIASLLVPTFSLLALLGLLNSRTGLILLYTAYELPLVIWALMTYIQAIPEEFEKAAMIDGYSRLETMRKITFPLARPALIAAGLFVLTFAWNDFVVALVMTSSESAKTLPVGIYSFLGFFGREWGPLTASAMLSIVPIVILFVVFQKYFVSGMTGGGLKG